MSFSTEWENQYSRGAHRSVFPWSDLVSYVKRYCGSLGPGAKVLELGCGAGANIPLFESLRLDYHGIDGSPSAIAELKTRFPALEERLAVGDFCRGLPWEGPFALVVDRASLTHNATRDIERALALVHERLEPGGAFIGIDWFSTLHSDYAKGEPGEDAHTRRAIGDGALGGLGRVHFSDRPHLQGLFSAFSLEHLELKTVQRELPESERRFAAWNLLARKAVLQ